MIKQLLDAQNLAEARAKLYQLLSLIYIKPPDQDFLKLLDEWVSLQSRPDNDFQLLSTQMKHGLSALESFFKKAETNYDDKLAQTLSVEFTRIFRGVKPYYSPLPPYESVYQEESGRVFSELSSEVQQEYRRFGLDIVSEFNGEPPDHLSFELEFMHLMCSREAEAWERNDEDEAAMVLRAEKEFMEKHLMTWLPKLCDKIREFDQLGFYCGLADLTEGWTVLDYQEHLQAVELL